jgi:O-antigen/teichoic acid export membrane protein
VAHLGAGRIVAAAASAVWLILAARHLSLSAYGDFTQVVSLSVILTAAADAGLSILLAHDVAAWPGASRTLLERALRARILLGVPACVALVVLYWCAAARPTLLVALLAAVSMVATMVHQSISVTARALDNVRPEAVNEVASRLFVLGVGFAVLWAGGSVAAAVAVYAAADVASACILRLVVVPRLSAEPSHAMLPLSLSRVSILGFTVAAMTVYSRADVWLLGVLGSSAQVARYAAPYRLFEGALIVASTFAALAAQRVARPTWREVSAGIRGLVLGAIAVTTLIAAVGGVAAHPLIELLYGPRYAGTATTLQILLVAAIPSAVVVVLMQVSGLLDRAGTAIAVVIALVGNVGGNLVVIPRWGISGAAWVTLATQTLLAMSLGLVVVRALGKPRGPEASIKAEGVEFADELVVPSLIAD